MVKDMIMEKDEATSIKDCLNKIKTGKKSCSFYNDNDESRISFQKKIENHLELDVEMVEYNKNHRILMSYPTNVKKVSNLIQRLKNKIKRE